MATIATYGQSWKAKEDIIMIILIQNLAYYSNISKCQSLTTEYKLELYDDFFFFCRIVQYLLNGVCNRVIVSLFYIHNL